MTAVLGSFVVGIVVLVLWNQVPGSEILHGIPFPAISLLTTVHVGAAVVSERTASQKMLRVLEGGANEQEDILEEGSPL